MSRKCRLKVPAPTRYHRVDAHCPSSPSASITTAPSSIPSPSTTACGATSSPRTGCAFTEEDYKARHAGVPTAANAQELASRHALAVGADALAAQKHDAMSAFVTREAFPLMPQVRESVASLHARGLRLAVVTGAVRLSVADHACASTSSRRGSSSWCARRTSRATSPRRTAIFSRRSGWAVARAVRGHRGHAGRRHGGGVGRHGMRGGAARAVAGPGFLARERGGRHARGSGGLDRGARGAAFARIATSRKAATPAAGANIAASWITIYASAPSCRRTLPITSSASASRWRCSRHASQRRSRPACPEPCPRSSIASSNWAPPCARSGRWRAGPSRKRRVPSATNGNAAPSRCVTAISAPTSRCTAPRSTRPSRWRGTPRRRSSPPPA